jgi:hypothetical protein
MRRWAACCLIAILAGCQTPQANKPTSSAPTAAAPPASSQPLDRASVIGMVRAASPSPTAISAPVAGDLQLVCLVGRGPGARPLTSADLAALGLTRDSAIALATANALAGLRPMASVTQIPAPGVIGKISGDYAEASRLLAHDEWTPLSQALGGHLLVAVPSADTVLYTKGGVPGALTTLASMARADKAQSAQPISDAVLRWTPTGWEQVAKPSPPGS